METNFNLSSLRTIQTPLLESLNGAHENVKKNILVFTEDKKIPTEYSAINTMAELEKIYKMIGLHSLEIIFNLNGEALKKVKAIDFDTETSIKILQSVEKILENSKNYVKSLINGANDQPTKFFEDYQALAVLIRKDVSIKDLFNPRLELKDSLPNSIKEELRRGVVITANNKKGLLENLKVIESVYLTRLLDFKKMLTNNGEFTSEEEQEKYQLACKNVYEKFDVAQKLKISKSHYILFGLCKFYICMISPALNEKFKDFVLENKKNIELNLEDFRKIIVNLTKDIEGVSESSKTGVLRTNDTIVKDVLFSIITAVQKNPSLMGLKVYAELSTYFNLESYAEQLIDTKMQSVQASKLNFNNIEKWFAELKEDFTLINSKKKSADNFKQHVSKLLTLSNKLAESVMSVKEVHVLISQVSATLAKIRSGSIQMTEHVERELSIALVLIEYGVNNIIKNHVESKYRNEYGSQAQVEVARIKLAEENNISELSAFPMPKLDSLSQKADERKSFAKIFEQVSLDLTAVEETLDLIINKKSDGLQTLEQSIKSLNEMKGIFSVIGKLDLVPPLEASINVWKNINSIPETISKEIRESIVIISGISLFVKSLRSENESEAEEIYENLIKRYRTGLFKPEDSSEEVIEIGVVEADTFESAGQTIIVESQPVDVKQIHRNKDEIIEDFNIALKEDLSSDSILFLVGEYLKAALIEEKVIQSALALVDVSLSVNKELENEITASTIQKMLNIENLGIQSKNKTLSKESKDKIQKYAELIELKDISKVSKKSQDLHNQVENVLSGLFSSAVLINLPELDFVKKDEPENLQVKEASLKVYIENTNDEELGQVFIEEAKDVLEQMHDLLLKLANGYETTDVVNIRRHFHTLKGSGRMVGLDFWGEAAWMTEQTLNRVISEDLVWSNTIYEEMKNMVEMFKGWLAELEASNSINVDLVSIKIIWQGINNKLTNHVAIEIPEILTKVEIPVLKLSEDLPVLKVEDENNSINITDDVNVNEMVSDLNYEVKSSENDSVTNLDLLSKGFEDINKETETIPEYIKINGKGIAYSLYKLYKEESVVNINNLKKYAHENYQDVKLDADFMRYAHTLASISKTVNIQKVASIAAILEDIAYFTGERDVSLNAEQMNIIRHSVDSLEVFQDINSTSDLSFYENILKKVTDLYESLVEFVENEQVEVENPFSESPAVESLTNEEIEEMIKQQVTEKVNAIAIELQNKYLESCQKFESKILEQSAKSIDEKVSLISQNLEKEYLEKVKSINLTSNKLIENLENSNKTLVNELENSNKKFIETLESSNTERLNIFEQNLFKNVEKSVSEANKSFRKVEQKVLEDVEKISTALAAKEDKVSFWKKLFGKR